MSKREIAYHFLFVFLFQVMALSFYCMRQGMQNMSKSVLFALLFSCGGRIIFLKCMRDTVETSADGTK